MRPLDNLCRQPGGGPLPPPTLPSVEEPKDGGPPSNNQTFNVIPPLRFLRLPDPPGPYHEDPIS